MEYQHYLVIGGGVAASLAFLAYFTKVPYMQIPAIVVGTVGGVAAGVGVGVLLLLGMGYELPKRPGDKPAESAGGGGMPMGGGGRGGMPMGGGGGMPMMGGGGARTPDAKAQLAALVTKLDQLLGKPLVVELSEDQKKVVQEQLKGLRDLDTLGTDDAKKRLDALLEVLKKDREALEKAGYTWPGQRPAGGRPASSPNPFKTGANREHLEGLQKQLARDK